MTERMPYFYFQPEGFLFKSFNFIFYFRLSYPNKLDKVLEADTHQKIVMNFKLKDLNSGDKVTAHQTFIRLTNTETQQEIFFVAEPDSDNHYTFTLVC